MKSNWQFLVIALILGFYSWYSVSFEQKVNSTVQVRLETTNQPRDLVVREGLISTIDVVVRGPKSLVRSIDSRKIGYSLDLGALKPGENILNFTPDRIPLKGAVEVVEIKPPRIVIQAEEVARKEVPVTVAWTGNLASDWLLKEKLVEPPKVILRGPKSMVDKIGKLSTQQIKVEGRTPLMFEDSVSLDVPGDMSVEPAKVKTLLVFGPKTREIWIRAPLVLDKDSARRITDYEPKEVRLHLEAPLRLIDEDRLRDQVTAFLRIDPGLDPGRYTLPFQVRLPEHTTLLKTRPEAVEITIKK